MANRPQTRASSIQKNHWETQIGFDEEQRKNRQTKMRYFQSLIGSDVGKVGNGCSCGEGAKPLRLLKKRSKIPF